MHPQKNNNLQPKRAANIDGFFAYPGAERPRQPIFKNSPVKPQPTPDKLLNMPKRKPGTIGAPAAAASATVADAIPLDRPSERPRQRGRHEPPRSKDKTGKKHWWSHPWNLRRFFKRGGLITGALVLALVLFLGFKFYRDIAKLTGNNNPLSLLSAFHPAHLKNQDGRVNILVAGNSADDVGHNGGDLTDSIMILSLNTRNNTALIMSIPRDLWVDIPGVGHSKINAAYPNGGMDLLQQVVENNLGVTIDYQALINYTAFKDLVNAVGGISITIKSDDPRGIYDPSLDYTSARCCALAKYPNGPVTLNGNQALNLARARGDAYGSYGFNQADFDRTTHQRQMLIAIKDKASSPSVIANPLKVAGLVDAVGNNVKTNLKLNEMETLYTYIKKISDSNIDSVNINTLKGESTTMLANYTSPNGQSALIPAAGLDDFSDIQAQLLKLLSNDPVVHEGANVVVLNGTESSGLARLQGNKLTSKGMNVLAESDAPADQATTTIIDNSTAKKPNTAKVLKKLYNATNVTNASLSAMYPSADFIVIIGQNVVTSSTSSSQ